MNKKYRRLRNNIYRKLEELSRISSSKDVIYRLWYYDGSDYIGADLNVTFTGRNIADIILKACSYIHDHAKYDDGEMVDLLQHHIEFLIDHCSGMTNIAEQTDMVIESVSDNPFLCLKPVSRD